MITSERGREAEEENFILTVSRRRTILEGKKWSKAKGKGQRKRRQTKKPFVCLYMLCVGACVCKRTRSSSKNLSKANR